MGRYSQNYRDPDYYSNGLYSQDNRINLIMPCLDKERFHSHEDFYDESFISKVQIDEDDKKISLICVDKDGNKLSKKLFHKKKTASVTDVSQIQPQEQLTEVAVP